MKLISMTDFVLEQEKKYNYGKSFDWTSFTNTVCNYAKFLKQPLELWMFVPCDEEGNLLNKPEIKRPKSMHKTTHEDLKNKYQQAKERVLFEGNFEVNTPNPVMRLYINGSKCLLKHRGGVENIEWLQRIFGNDVCLTETAQKQIGL